MATKKKPRRITQEELAGMHYDPVEKVYYDTSELEERGMDVPEWAKGGDKSEDFKPTHVLSESGRLVPVGGETGPAPDPAVARGGGKFHAPAEGKIVWQEKDDDGNITYQEREYPARTIHFRNRAELKAELERRRIQATDQKTFPFDRGRDGLYGLVPYDEWKAEREEELARERAARIDARVEKLGPVALREDVEIPTDQAPSTPVPDKPVKVTGAGVPDDEGLTEKERAKRSSFPEGHPSGKEPETEYEPKPVATKIEKAKSRPLEAKAEPSQPDVGAVVDERDFNPFDREFESVEEREKAEAELAKLDKNLAPLEEAVKAVEEEPDTYTVGVEGESREGESLSRDEITLRGLDPSQEIPEPTDDPDLTDVELAEEPPEPPMEAGTKDTPAGDIPAPPSLKEPEPTGGPDLTDVELEELEESEELEGVITAEEVEALAAKLPSKEFGFDWHKQFLKEFITKRAYDPTSLRDRMRMEFLIKFFGDEYPVNPGLRAQMGTKALNEMHEDLEESIQAAEKRRRDALGKDAE